MRFDGHEWCCDRVESTLPIVLCKCGKLSFFGLPCGSKVTGPVGERTNNPWRVTRARPGPPPIKK